MVCSKEKVWEYYNPSWQIKWTITRECTISSQQVSSAHYILTTYRFAVGDHYRSARLPPNVARFHQYLKGQNTPSLHFGNARAVPSINRNPADEEYKNFNVLRQMPWANSQAQWVFFTIETTLGSATQTHTHTSTTRAAMHCANTLRRNRADAQNSRRMSRAPRHSSQLRGKSDSSSAAHLAVADRDPHGELGRSGAAGLLRHCGGGPSNPMPGRPPPRAAGARERGVERRRGEGDVVVVEVVRRRRRREEEVESSGAREHLEVDVGGGGGATAWNGNGAGDERVATRPRTLSLSRSLLPFRRVGFCQDFAPSACWGFGMPPFEFRAGFFVISEHSEVYCLDILFYLSN